MGIVKTGSSSIEPVKPSAHLTSQVEVTEKVTGTVDKRQSLIQRQGCIQAAIQSQAVFSHSTSYEEWWDFAVKTADKMIEYINKE